MSWSDQYEDMYNSDGTGWAQGGSPSVNAAVIGGGFSYLSDRATQSAQRRAAKAARRWSRQMSNTAHQRQVTDLRMAGLNPMLSASLGGASTPGASMAAQHPIRSPMAAGIDAAQGVASAKLTGHNAKLASLEAKHKTAFYKMLQKGPGGPEIAAFNSMFPGNKHGQTAAAINLGVGKAKEGNWLANTGKQVKKWWKQLDNYMFDVQYPDNSGKRWGKARHAETLKEMAAMERPSFEKNERWADALETLWRRENVPGFNINYKRR